MFNILKDPMFIDKISPDDFIDMFIDSGIKLTKPSIAETTTDINALRHLVGKADKGRSIRMKVPGVKKTDPNAILKNKVLAFMVKKYGINS